MTMPPKKIGPERLKRKNVMTTIELKKELISKYENGARLSELAAKYNMAKSTISTILKNKEVIKAANVAKGVKSLTNKRSPAVEEVEKLLLVWINENQMARNVVSDSIICEKARQLYLEIRQSTGGNSTDEFKASKGWFENFKKRAGIRGVSRHGEASAEHKDAVDQFVIEFKDFVDKEGLMPQQVFNCDETHLFWKKMPERTYITQEEKALPGHKPMKDRLTLLLCGNASGDLKMKPMVVYHSDNPRIFKKKHVDKSKLSVMWRSNPKAWMTRQFFTEWMEEVFAPTAKKYLEENHLPLKALLVLDSDPAHPPALEDKLSVEFGFIQIKFLPPYITPVVQPMEQHIITTFKKLYVRTLFQRCFDVTDGTELTLREFWKDHFNIFHCVKMIDKAWEEVSQRTMQSAWKNLWPGAVPAVYYEGFGIVGEPDQDAGLVEDIITLGRSMGLEVDQDDIEELVKEQNFELTIEELQDLLREDQPKNQTSIPLAGKERSSGSKIPTATIRELLECWDKTQNLVERWYPNMGIANRDIQMLEYNVVQDFRHILNSRQKRIPMYKFMLQDKPSASGYSGYSGMRNITPENYMMFM